MAEISKSGGCSTELSPAEEMQAIRSITFAAESQTKEGDVFYLINRRWWHDWLLYANNNKPISPTEESSLEHNDSGSSNTSKRPSSIDNSCLICEAASENSTADIELNDTLVEGTDYILVPEGVWNQLYAWYGGGPILARKVIDSGKSKPELSVEVYPLRLYLHRMPKGDKYTIRLSKKEKVGALHKKACEIFDLNTDQVCIWDYFSRQKFALLNDPEKTLEDVNIQMDQDILVEIVGDADGCTSSSQDTSFTENDSSPLAEPSHRNSSSKGELSQFQNLSSAIRESEKTPTSIGVSIRGSSGGLTGLINFGNTCFMNSAIQCLVHTPEFARFFQENYQEEINWHNPLGTVGELALAFGDLLRKLWAPGRTPFAPRRFKATLARFAQQFSGYDQHDSQELLAYLLDGLHEDLNRVKDKPYIKSRDADGRPDEEVADEYWANHIARNDSIIVDVCQGQYKSTLVCPVCDKISVTFDPFMYLSLPLQSTATRTITVTVFSCDGSSRPVTCTVTVPKQGRCKDLLQALNGDCSLKNNEKILLAEIRNHLIHRFLVDPLMALSSIKDDDHLGDYKIPKFMKNMRFLQLIQRQEELETGNPRGRKGWKPFGTPLVFPVSCDTTITRADVQLIVHTMLSPMLKKDNLVTKLSIKLLDHSNAILDISVGNEKTISWPEHSMSLHLFLDWTSDSIKRYHINYLEKLPDVSKYGPLTRWQRNETPSLYTCLESFLREEPLVPQDMWYCPQCEEQRQASKKLDLWRLPDVFVIHLKRFSFSRMGNHKVETFVNFPIHDFDLTNYVATKNNSNHQVYELYASINHYGGMGSGHYTAHIKLIGENRWYNFDDSHISAINEDEVKSNAAYVLFYRRVKTDDDM